MVDAIGNLLQNALKYGGDSAVGYASAAALTTKGVALEVTDNGDGIPRGEHRRIF